MLELNTALKGFDQDKTVGAIVITGSQKAFAAGEPIFEVLALTVNKNNFQPIDFSHWYFMYKFWRRHIVPTIIFLMFAIA